MENSGSMSVTEVARIVPLEGVKRTRSVVMLDPLNTEPRTGLTRSAVTTGAGWEQIGRGSAATQAVCATGIAESMENAVSLKFTSWKPLTGEIVKLARPLMLATLVALKPTKIDALDSASARVPSI